MLFELEWLQCVSLLVGMRKGIQYFTLKHHVISMGQLGKPGLPGKWLLKWGGVYCESVFLWGGEFYVQTIQWKAGSVFVPRYTCLPCCGVE